jgi:hypothetical protein
VYQLRLAFKASECDGWPKAQVLIDDDLYEDHQFSKGIEEIFVPLDLLDGKHLLTIEIYGKQQNNTVFDSYGRIVKDQILELQTISVDNIELPQWTIYTGVYKFNNQTYPQATIWGCNGVWEWPFEMPIIDWLLTAKHEQSEKYTPPLDGISFKDRMQLNLEKYDMFANTLNDIDDV